MKVANRVDLQISYHKEKRKVVCGDNINQTYCGNHLAIYTNIKSLCYMPETNTMFYVNYISIKDLLVISVVPLVGQIGWGWGEARTGMM